MTEKKSRKKNQEKDSWRLSKKQLDKLKQQLQFVYKVHCKSMMCRNRKKDRSIELSVMAIPRVVYFANFNTATRQACYHKILYGHSAKVTPVPRWKGAKYLDYGQRV